MPEYRKSVYGIDHHPSLENYKYIKYNLEFKVNTPEKTIQYDFQERINIPGPKTLFIFSMFLFFSRRQR